MSLKIEFTARNQGGAVVWDGPDGQPAKGHRIHVPKGHPEHEIEFTINDKTGLGLGFDEHNAFHVWENEGCPPPGIATDQIELVQASGDKVRILNRNSGPARTLQYQLNVIGKDGQNWPCDPIIDNDGGGNAA
jgi:hypothetical protein